MTHLKKKPITTSVPSGRHNHSSNKVYFISLQWHFNAANVIRHSLHSDGGGESGQLYMELLPSSIRVTSTLGLGEQVLAFSSSPGTSLPDTSASSIAFAKQNKTGPKQHISGTNKVYCHSNVIPMSFTAHSILTEEENQLSYIWS